MATLAEYDAQCKEKAERDWTNRIHYNVHNELLKKTDCNKVFYAANFVQDLKEGLNLFDGEFDYDIYSEKPNGLYFVEKEGIHEKVVNIEKVSAENKDIAQATDEKLVVITYIIELPFNNPKFKVIYDLKKKYWRTNMFVVKKIEKHVKYY